MPSQWLIINPQTNNGKKEMIAVIADDFTGAAEIAGLGLRYGLKVEIESHEFTKSDADLIIIATDTRSMSSNEAYNEVLTITKQIKKQNCDWLYKKTDSVFRGHIYKELLAILDTHMFSQALLVPANPMLGRKIEDGVYYINNQLLHETNFSEDPDFALTTSNVLELIRSDYRNSVSLARPDEIVSKPGITIGEAVSVEDLNKWAAKVKNGILPAGGAGFFSSLLEIQGFKEKNKNGIEDYPFGRNFLFVCGSALSKGRFAANSEEECEIMTLPMPEAVFHKTQNANAEYDKWKENIINAFQNTNGALIEIDQPVVRDRKFSSWLRETMAQLVFEVSKEVEINELLIDGGATVYSIAEKMGMQKFFPVQELAPGVVRMKIEGKENLFVTIKPGSYLWPEKLLELSCDNK